MSLFQLIYKCCCKHDKEVENIPESKCEQIEKHELDGVKFLQAPDESSIFAAPSPHMDEQSDCPKLQIKILESSVLESGTLLNINPFGLENSKRGKFDGKSFFGSKLRDGLDIINDFVIDEAMKGFGVKHFVIVYNSLRQKYCISDLGGGSGTFVRIDSEMILKDGHIISYGSSHMTIYYNSEMTLTIKFLEGPKSGEVFNFYPNENTVLIGRMVDCRLRFDDNSMSRYQSTIQYINSKGWVITDGNSEKRSTNGTWVFVEKDFELFEGMVFKAGKTLFEVHIL